MNQLQKFLLKLVYYIGAAHGLFSFNYNSSTQQFHSSKLLTYHNKLMMAISLILFALAIKYFFAASLSDNNLVIELSQPISLFTILVIICDSYLMMWINEKEILNILNSALKYQKDGRMDMSFLKVLYLTTFLYDVISIIINILSIFVIPIIFPDYSLFLLTLVNVFQFSKVVPKFMTNILINAFVFNAYLMKNLEKRIFRSIDNFNLLILKNPKGSAQHGCVLSEEIDHFIIDYANVFALYKNILKLFSRHLVLLLCHSLPDILVHVNIIKNIKDRY